MFLYEMILEKISSIMVEKGGEGMSMHTDKLHMAEQWMHLYGDQVMHVCLISLGDYHLAQDACQETFFRAWKHCDRFRFESSEKTWLMRIAVNVCRDMQRAKWFRQGKDVLPLEDERIRAEDATFAIGPVTQMVLNLPEKYRLTLLLHYVHGMKATQISHVLGVAYPTVLTRLRRGRELVKKQMEEGGADA